jgi:hypothetical protein
MRASQHSLALWLSRRAVTRPLRCFSICSCPGTLYIYMIGISIARAKGNKKSPSSCDQDEERHMLSCCHLHSLIPHDTSLSKYVQRFSSVYIPSPVYGGTGEFYSHRMMISSRCFRIFFTIGIRTGLSATACSLVVTTHRYSSCQSICVIRLCLTCK